MKVLKRVFNWLNINLEPLCMVILFYAMLILIVTEVILRYFFSRGISWSEEGARFIFVWLIFFSISYATRNNRHIKMYIILEKMPDKVRRVIMLLSDFAFFMFAILLLKAAMALCEYNARVGNRAIAINVSINIVYMAGVVGFCLMAIRCIQCIVWKFRHWGASIAEFENFGGGHFKNDKKWFELLNIHKKVSDGEGE